MEQTADQKAYEFAKEKYQELANAALDLMVHKSKEYTRGHPFENFYRGAGILNTTAEQALLGYLAKHWASISVLVKDINETSISAPEEVWKEKLMDNINYSLILYAMVCCHKLNGIEKQASQEQPQKATITYRDSEREFR